MASIEEQIKEAYDGDEPPPVEIIDARESEDFREDEGGRWVTFCQTHGEFLQHRHKADAESVFGRMSVNWCGECRQQAKEEALIEGAEAYEADLADDPQARDEPPRTKPCPVCRARGCERCGGLGSVAMNGDRV